MKYRMVLIRTVLNLIVIGSLAVATSALAADATVSITPDLKSPGHQISPDFSGLSFETKMLLPDDAGKYFFSADNADLIALFKSLGVKNLRIGGNTADYSYVKIPTEPDIDSLFAFAQAAGVKIIYNLRLKETTDPAGDVHLVKYIMDHYKPLVSCFTIGNEPNMYFTEYPAYRDQWKQFADAILAAVPDAQFNGPSTTPGKTTWAKDFATEFAKWGHVRLITQHSYPGGNAQKVPDPAAAREKILSPDMDKGYEKFYESFVPEVLKNHEQYRLEEANSLFHGGATGVSNTFASALWGLDYMHWWAAHQAAGINFHTGNHRVKNETDIPGGYDISYTGPSGIKLHPIAYALKAFTFAADGQSIPVAAKSSDDKLNLTAYGVLGSDKTLVLTIINKENGADARNAEITINAASFYAHAEMLLLQSPSNDIAQLTGPTLGGSEISGDGKWTGKWQDLLLPASPGKFTLKLPSSSAVVVQIVQITP